MRKIAFQSTHPHGVRRCGEHRGHLLRKFQSTHPHGVRRGTMGLQGAFFFGFNPRTRTGCDRIEEYLRGVASFQSTHPHGVRP